MRQEWLQSIKTVVERQQGMLPERDNDRLIFN
jgi:hypothetical protein